MLYIYIYVYVTGSHQPFSLETWWSEDLSNDVFSLAFVFSPIYLKLEGNVPPQRIEMLEPLEMESDIA